MFTNRDDEILELLRELAAHSRENSLRSDRILAAQQRHRKLLWISCAVILTISFFASFIATRVTLLRPAAYQSTTLHHTPTATSCLFYRAAPTSSFTSTIPL